LFTIVIFTAYVSIFRIGFEEVADSSEDETGLVRSAGCDGPTSTEDAFGKRLVVFDFTYFALGTGGESV
jgi:hypothetical protein